MRITNEVPESWQDLQDKVCKYLNQAGYHAETTKTIEMVRGKVEVDVFATSDDELLKQFICECKYWETPVPRVNAWYLYIEDWLPERCHRGSVLFKCVAERLARLY